MAAVDEQRCGNPNCPDPTSTSRLQKIPESFTGPRLSELFHRQKAACGRWCGFKGPPKTPGRKRNGETLATPVGKRLETDRCPPILRSIDALWGYRCSRLPSPAARTSLTGTLTLTLTLTLALALSLSLSLSLYLFLSLARRCCRSSCVCRPSTEDNPGISLDFFIPGYPALLLLYCNLVSSCMGTPLS